MAFEIGTAVELEPVHTGRDLQLEFCGPAVQLAVRFHAPAFRDELPHSNGQARGRQLPLVLLPRHPLKTQFRQAAQGGHFSLHISLEVPVTGRIPHGSRGMRLGYFDAAIVEDHRTGQPLLSSPPGLRYWMNLQFGRLFESELVQREFVGKVHRW